MGVPKRWAPLSWPYYWRIPDEVGEYEVADGDKKIASGFGNLKGAAEKYLTMSIREKKMLYFRYQTPEWVKKRREERLGNWVKPMSYSREEILKTARSMKGYFSKQTIRDFIKLCKELGDSDNLVITEFSKIESSVLLALAKSGGIYNDAIKWCVETKAVGKTVLSDVKKSMVELGMLHEETIRNGAVGRPRKQLYLAVEDLMN